MSDEFEQIETADKAEPNVISVLDYDLDGGISKLEGVVANYSTDTSAGYPLIEKYRVDVDHPGVTPGAQDREYGIVSIRNHKTGYPQCYIPFGGSTGITLLQAVCRVVAYEHLDSPRLI